MRSVYTRLCNAIMHRILRAPRRYPPPLQPSRSDRAALPEREESTSHARPAATIPRPCARPQCKRYPRSPCVRLCSLWSCVYVWLLCTCVCDRGRGIYAFMCALVCVCVSVRACARVCVCLLCAFLTMSGGRGGTYNKQGVPYLSRTIYKV